MEDAAALVNALRCQVTGVSYGFYTLGIVDGTRDFHIQTYKRTERHSTLWKLYKQVVKFLVRDYLTNRVCTITTVSISRCFIKSLCT